MAAFHEIHHFSLNVMKVLDYSLEVVVKHEEFLGIVVKKEIDLGG